MYKKLISLLCIASMIVTFLPMPKPAAAAEPIRTVTQKSIPEVNAFPSNPAPYSYMNWKQRALDYDAFVYDWNKTSASPTIQWDTTHYNMPYNTFKMPSYYGDTRLSQDGEQEGVNMLASVAGASLVGVNKANQDGNNYVDLIRTFKHNQNNRKLFYNWANQTHPRNQTDWWYDVAPNMLYYIIAEMYPNDPNVNQYRTDIADALYDMTVSLGGANANFWHQSFNHDTQSPVDDKWKTPEGGMISALVEYWEYKRTNNSKYLDAAKWSMDYFNDIGSNPYYEVGAVFAPYIAARMNAEQGTNYDINHFFKWILSGSNVRNGWGTIQENWNGYDVYGLQGSRNDGGGYAFLMNTFATAFFAPTVKYDASYANVVGKWLLNVSNAARFFYADQMPADKQYYGTKYINAPENVIAYEGLRKSKNNQSPSATGDPAIYWQSWGCGETCSDLGLYGSSWAGFFGAIFKDTNVEKILQIDLNALDFYKDTSYPTYLYYNPYTSVQDVQISLSSASDLFDTISGQYIAKNVSGTQSFSIPANNSVVLVVAPSNGVLTYQSNKTLINNVPVAYSSSLQNLALNKPVTVSSTDKTQSKEYAIDGDPNTRWASLGTDSQWIYVDLGSTYKVNSVELSWEAAYGKSYKIQVSDDAVIWTDVYSTITGNGGIDSITFAPTDARYVRMYGTQRGTTYGYSLYEFAVYSVPVTAPGAPSGVNAVGGEGSAVVHFVPPASNGGSEILKYTVTAWSKGTAVKTVEGTAIPITVTGLNNGSEYTFTVTAVNAKGESAPSAKSNKVIAIENLALGKPVTVSSRADAEVSGENAVDGNPNTRWGTGALDPQWIYVDLGSNYNVNKVELNWEAAYGKSYKIQVSSDTVTWRDVYSTTTGDGGIDDITFTPTNTRYVRMYGTQRGTNYGYSLYEFAVYAVTATIPGKPTGVAGDKEVTLNWDAVTGADSYTVYKYEGTSVPADPNNWILVQSAVTATTFSVTGLTNGTSFAFAVKAVNAGGASDYSAATIATPTAGLPPAPAVPINLTGAAGDKEVSLNWDAVAGADSYSVYKYEGTSVPADPNNWILVQSAVTATRFSVTGLTNGTSYAFAVKAVNAGGASDYSAATIVTPIATLPPAPAVPINLTGAARDKQISLNWDAVAGADSYTVYKYEGTLAPTDPSNWTLVQTGVTAATYTVTGLTNGTSYVFAVKAVNAGGASDYSAATIATPTAGLPPAPAVPINLTGGAGDKEVSLNWKAVTGADSYTVYKYEGTSVPADPNNWILVQSAVTATTFSVTGLANGMSYVFAVKAVNAGGASDYSAATIAMPITALPSAPAVPINLTGGAGDKQVSLNWEAVTGADSYTVYKYEGTLAPTDPSTWDIVQSSVTANTYKVMGLTNGTSYVFVVKAVNAGGASDYSAAMIATPIAALPENLGGNDSSGNNGNDTSVVKSTTGTIIIPNGRAGEVSYDDDIIVSLLPGAGEQELRITIEKLLNTSNLLIDKEMLVSHVYEITKNVTGNFQKRVTLSMKFDPSLVGDNQRIAIFYYDEGKKIWVEVGGIVNGNRITVEVDHFTKFAVMAVDVKKDEGGEPVRPEITFTDIAGHWGENAILSAVERKIVSGYPDGMFKPNSSITRAEFTDMMVNALKLEGTGSALAFTDQDKIGAWATEAVAKAVEAGIVSGYKDGSFQPNARITRAEMASVIARALRLSPDASATTGFADDKDIPKWAKDGVEAIRKLGIVNGRNGNKFAPSETATRAEAAVMLIRMLEHVNDQK